MSLKGQGKYVIGVFIMIAAIVIGGIGEFATEYTLNTALNSMNENYARYDSMVHSYMIVSDDINNVENHSRMADDLSTVSGYKLCQIDSSYGLDRGSDYRITFTNLEGNVWDGSCTALPGYHYTDDDVSFKSPGLTKAPYIGVYPDIAFYSPHDGGKNFYIHTRVKPDRD